MKILFIYLFIYSFIHLFIFIIINKLNYFTVLFILRNVILYINQFYYQYFLYKSVLLSIVDM